MRILYIINSFYRAGAEKLVYDLAPRIRQYSEFVGIVALFQYNNETEAEMVRILESQGVKILIVGKRVKTDVLKTIRAITQFAKKHQVDLVHGHSIAPMMFAKVTGRILGIPVVCTIHNTRGYSKVREKLTGWMVNRYVSIGASVEEYMKGELSIAPKNIVRIYNAIDIEQFQGEPVNQHFWEQYGGKVGEQVILNIARVHESKNQMCIAKAVKKCLKIGYHNFKVYILGAYNESDPFYQKLICYIRTEKLEKHIIFLGMHKNVPSFLANADCFVMTSVYEGLSVAYLEAVISGLPIIVTDMPFVRELNELAPCSIVIPQNDSNALAQIIANKDYAKQTAETVVRFKENFSMDKFVKQHRQLYQELIRAHTKHR